MNYGNGDESSQTAFSETPLTSSNHVPIPPSRPFHLYQKIFDIGMFLPRSAMIAHDPLSLYTFFPSHPKLIHLQEISSFISALLSMLYKNKQTFPINQPPHKNKRGSPLGEPPRLGRHIQQQPYFSHSKLSKILSFKSLSQSHLLINPKQSCFVSAKISELFQSNNFF